MNSHAGPSGASTIADGARSVRSPDGVRVGGKVGRYAILETVGAGGMGVVFAAYDPELDRKVALKLVRPDGGDTRADARQGRLLREAQAMAKVTHPNVLPVHDAGECEHGVFLAMEFVEGQTLAARLDRHREGEAKLSIADILALFVQAGRGLEAAHAAGLVHRDFKPDNVMLGSDGRVRVMDFGLARAGDGTPSAESAAVDDALPRDTRRSGITEDLTRTGAILGTPAYMSPEQHLGRPAGAASDQFSFCVALWEGVYGTRPFAGETLGQLANSVVGGERRRAPSGASLPARVQSAIERGLARKPDDRWPDMTQLLAALSDDHAARRRQRLIGVGAVLATGAIVAAAAQARSAPTLPCADASSVMNASWNADLRARASDAFGATELTYASESWSAAAQRLDAFASRWNASRVDACEATMVRHEQSDELFDRRVACLERARTQFDAMLGVFTDADADVVERSFRITSTLPTIDHCDDPEALLAAVPPPVSDSLTAEVAVVRAKLADALAQHSAGRFDDARRLADEAMPPEDFGYPPVRAEALAVRGGLLGEQGEYEQAEAVLRDALYVARVNGHDEVAFEAAGRLAYIVGHLAQRPKEGLEWAWHARAELERRGSPPVDVAFLEQNEGMLYSDQGDYDSALERFTHVLNIRMEAFGPDDNRTLLALNNLAIAHYYLGQRDKALEIHERVLETRERVLGPDHPDVAQSLMNLGIDYESMGRYPEGIAATKRALQIEERVRSPDDPKLAATISALASLHDASRDHAGAIALQQRALEIREAAFGPDHPSVADSLVNMGLSLDSMERSEEALPILRRALAIYEAHHGGAHFTVAIAQGNLAGALEKLGRLDEALDFRRKSLETKRAALPADHPSLGYAYAGIAKTLLELDRPLEAIEPAETAIGLWSGDPPKVDPQYLAVTKFDLAKILEAAGRDRARRLALAREALVPFEDDPSDEAAKDRARISAFIDAHD